MSITNLGAPTPPESITMPPGTGLANITSNAVKYASLGANAGGTAAVLGGVFGAVKGMIDTKKLRESLAKKDYLKQKQYGKQVEQLNTDGTSMADSSAAGTGYFTNQYLNKSGGKMKYYKDMIKADSLPKETIELVFKLSIDVANLSEQKDQVKPKARGGKCSCGCKLEEGGKCSCGCKIHTAEDGVKIPKAFRDGGRMNFIPKGVLHAHKNNIGDKGIPVVMREDGGELRKVAEIEKEEIIFTLDVTELLEDYAKRMEAGTITDEDLIRVGKLIQKEVVNNTVDMTEKLITQE